MDKRNALGLRAMLLACSMMVLFVFLISRLERADPHTHAEVSENQDGVLTLINYEALDDFEGNALEQFLKQYGATSKRVLESNPARTSAPAFAVSKVFRKGDPAKWYEATPSVELMEGVRGLPNYMTVENKSNPKLSTGSPGVTLLYKPEEHRELEIKLTGEQMELKIQKSF